jgi:probable phosphoglycerate mutase
VTLVLLVRHAVTEATGRRLSGSTPGIHLSADGQAQAGRLAERLAPLRIAAVYASPLERCVETARPIAQPRRLLVRPVPELEEVGYGRWTGRSLAQLTRTALWKKIQQSPSSVRFPGGETLVEAQRRGVSALEMLTARHPNGTVVVVSHADLIRLSLAHYAGVHIDLFQRIVVSPASVSAVLLGDRIPRILRVNDTGRLDDLAVRRGPGSNRSEPDGGRAGPGRGRQRS